MRKVLFILGQLTDTDADWLADHGERVRVAKGTTLIKHGTRISTVYIILEGSMAVVTARGVQLAEVASGDILGEMSLVDSGLTAASITTLQDSLVLAISKQQLMDKLRQDVGFAARFYRALALFLADRMRNTISRMGYDSNSPADNTPAPTDGDELDEDVLDNVHLAGARFERMLKKLAG
jgi:CRP/FNR family transcriptional regulator, cyclic AMP receptor protein